MTPIYEAPIADLVAALRSTRVEVDDELEFALAELGRFARDVLAPTDALADREGVRFDSTTAKVTVPPAVAAAYRSYVASGWPAASVDGRHGGGGLPYPARLAIEEILCSSNLALSLNPMLTHGAIELLGRWGSDEQKRRYLPLLVSGEWTGTMNLTEADAGTDVGAVRTRATRADDGTWRLSGTKIFITWGEHDVAENIIHMVLARTPDAPLGTQGISLFVVPKVLPDGTRNRVWCRGVERKLGIHGSPTCVIELDGAVGELVGVECGGMAAMFTMMNAARLAIAVQGVAVGQRSYEQALDYACTRRQGVAAGAVEQPARIIDHPDVRRMLLDLRSTTRAMRLLVLSVGASADAGDSRRVALLTPIAKAWCTDQGVRAASTALQVFGGLGYVEDTGIAQRLRDSRIGPIYEGTNGVQAIDLVTRRVIRDGGVAMGELLDEVTRFTADVAAEPLARWRVLVGDAHEACCRATKWVLDDAVTTQDVLAGATAYLDLIGTTVAGWLLGVHALRTAARGEDADVAFNDAEVFAVEQLVRVPGVVTAATAGAARLGFTTDTKFALATT